MLLKIKCHTRGIVSKEELPGLSGIYWLSDNLAIRAINAIRAIRAIMAVMAIRISRISLISWLSRLLWLSGL